MTNREIFDSLKKHDRIIKPGSKISEWIYKIEESR
jgi:hypothetical protein